MSKMDTQRIEKIIEIAKDKEVGERFIKFAVLAFGPKGNLHWDPTYVREWAGRFAKGTEYGNADATTLKHLFKVDGRKQAVEIYGGEIAFYNRLSLDEGRRQAKARFKRAGFRTGF